MVLNNFSVIIPLFNKCNYIARAIESVLAQTYEQYEIIIVDDGSTDGGIFQIEHLKSSCLKIVTQKNMGVSKARNLGVEHSKYDFVVFLDADDVWNSSLLTELNVLVNSFPGAGIYGVNNYFVYSDGRKTYEKYNNLFGIYNFGIIRDYFDIFAKFGKSPFCNSGCCYPKIIFNGVGGYRVGIKLTEDSDLWCRIAFKHEIAYTSLPLITYYMDTTGNTHHVFEKRDFEVILTLKKALSENSIENSKVKSVKKLLAFQKLNFAKRAIYSGNHFFALKKLIDKDLFLHYPLKIPFLIVISFLPTNLVHVLRRIMSK